MAIKITTFPAKKGKPNKEKFCLQDDGVYWFLCPYFMRLFEQAGQMIDLYGTSNFRDDSLLELDNILADAMKAAVAQPDQWNQKIGIRIKPRKQTLYDNISKKDVLEAIDSLKNITAEAIKNNAVVTFEGL